MPSTNPNKEWMTIENRMTIEYMQGVGSFISFAKQNAEDVDRCFCPCVKCRNLRKRNLEVIAEHLICDGIDKSYTTWIYHGELFSKTQINIGGPGTSTSNRNENASTRLTDMLDDTFGHVRPEDLDACLNEAHGEDDCQAPHGLQGNVEYDKLIKDALEPLYPSCQGEHTKLSITIELLSMKARHQWSNNSFTELLNLIKKILPEQNTLPDSTYNSKKLIKSLRLKQEIIHACPNDCILYWKEHANKDKCPTCDQSRWKPMDSLKPRTKQLPWKKLRYFPLTHRLQRMYSVPRIAEQMRWHASSVENENYMRHPVDSSCWKSINIRWSDFASELRNVRLGLATDGFNPFGNKNNSYSCWPVMIVPYNLPPSMCMRKEFTMLTLLIPGPKGPGHDIDIYLQPLVAELNELWSTGVNTYDSYTKSIFNMKAILLWAIHDFPAYGHLSGCRTAGQYACPVCSEGIDSVWLSHGKKFCYMGHRRFLMDLGHPFRTQKSQFNGKEEHAKHPRRLRGSEVLSKMNIIQTNFGKVDGKKRKRATNEENSSAWSKRSILFDLPYWRDLPIRHNLDVMHVEKNVTENLIATIMDTKGKTKDGIEARLDLKEMKIRKKLWPVLQNDKWHYPIAPFCLSREEKEIIYKTLHNLKVPIGYSANWKHNVSLEDLQFKGLKSHDYHILMQQLLPVLLMHAFKKEKPLRAAIRQLSIFFNVLCSKVITRVELLNMRVRIAETLCVFEKYFPPSFFVSMTHLVVHLAEEALVCGPVRYRWMYPFERMMKTYKYYVKNHTYPEGSIAEQYLMEECMRYCMEYMSDSRKETHKQGEVIFVDHDVTHGYPIDKKGKVYCLQTMQYQQVRKWVLEHSPENIQWEEKYQSYLQHHKTSDKHRRSNYIPWLREQLKNEKTSSFKRLVDGPNFNAISYRAYVINGYIFCTAESEMSISTQNSGVSMKALTSFRSSAKDKNLVEEEVTYYGIIKQILELDYGSFKETVFYCDWVRIEDRVNGCVVDPETGLVFVNFGRLMKTSHEDNEPFILASQATQVFYCKDHTRDDWYVVLDAPKRLNQDVDAYEDPLVFEARTKADALALTLVTDALDEDGD